MVTAVMVSLNVTVTVDDGDTFVAPLASVAAVTVGGVIERSRVMKVLSAGETTPPVA
jgi:hypothetical protein